MSSFRKSTILAALAGAASVSAHGHVTKVVADGVSYDGFDPTSAPYATQPDSITWSNGATDNGFVLSSAVGDADIICHLDATNAALSAPVTAGSDVAITWNQWPDSHKGPVIDYLADCGDDCSTVDKTTLKWFKIDEMGQVELGAGSGTTGKWADDVLIEDGLTWTATIPASIKPGNYVLRHELIALHEGGTVGKTQMYPQCINLQVKGSGTQSPEGTLGTSLYTPTDAGINYNIYNDETNPTYEIPGPALPTFGSGSSSDETATTSTAAAATTDVAESTTTSAPSVAATSTLATSVATTPSAAATTSSAAAVAPTTTAAAEPVVSEPVATDSAEATSTTAAASSTPTKVGCSSRRKRRNHQRRHAPRGPTRLH
ncbi:hypothetical protein MGN70_007424 [Eutypa lata]|nr:hypothetical protein MGN70_007424 [Eutypa lata]